MKKISEFLSEKFHFLGIKFSVYLNRLLYKVGLKTPLQESISEPEFYGDLVYKLWENLTFRSNSKN